MKSQPSSVAQGGMVIALAAPLLALSISSLQGSACRVQAAKQSAW